MAVQMIGTWKMCFDAFSKVKDLLYENADLAIVNAIKSIEDNKDVHTVGRYSVANQEGFLELDSAFMNGDNLHVGSVISAREIVNPIEVAYDLTKYRNNCILSSFGADKYAKENGFKTSSHLETSDDLENKHDTVGVISLVNNKISVGISSSGRAKKHLGRVGDSPLVGSGFYGNSLYGGAVATGNGEDILRGCLAKEIVDGLSFGLDVDTVVQQVGERHLKKLLEEYDETFFMLLALDTKGNFSAFTSKDMFPFATVEDHQVKLYFALRENNKTVIKEANQYLLRQYIGD